MTRPLFWTHLAERHPSLGTAKAGSSSVSPPLAGGLSLVLYLAVREVGLFVRCGRGVDSAAARAALAPHLPALAAEPDGFEPDGFNLGETHAVDTQDEANRDEATDWLAERAGRWQAAFEHVFADETA